MAVGELTNVLNQECVSIRVWEEDGHFIAKCLDIPGCISEGETREAALTNIDEAIAMCLDIIRQDAENSEHTDEVVSEVVQHSIRGLAHHT